MTMMEVEVNRYTAASTTTTQPVVEAPSSAAGISREQLQIYYARLFPFELLHQWLSYTPPKTEPKTNNNHGTLLENNNNNSDIINNNTVHSTTKKSTASKLFAHREFSMTIETAGGDEVYIRYQSFHSAADLAAAVVKRRPIKLDIGAIFSHPPVNHECVVPKSAFSPVARELVFDIDLTDYDGVRHCGCSGASICKTCWQFMDMAIAVVDPGLRRDFGFAHIQWFYSGRRGVHCWVCDDRARELTDAGRSAVANYFNIDLGTDSNKDMDLPDPLPPVLERSLKILEPMFVEKVLPAPENGGHGLLATPTQWNPLLDSIPSAARAVGDNLRKKWEAPDCRSSPAEKWAELSSHLKFYIKEKLAPVSKNKLAKMTDTAERRRLTNWCAATIFQHTYPRLDINVSKMRNHLLKSPFCVHPKTGRVCVPIVVTRTTSPLVATKVDFDPFSVPTLPILLQELDQYRQDHPEDEDNDNNGTGAAAVMRDWEKTSLKKYYDPYIRDFLEPLQKSIFRANREVMEQQAALATDF